MRGQGRGVLVFLAVLAAQNALAQSRNQCIDNCFNTFSPSQLGGSEELRRECLETCNKPNILFGAIAYGAVSHAYGYAWGKGNAADAVHTAMADCGAHGRDCKLVGSYSNSCMAVAAVEAKNRFVSAVAANGNQAQANAMRTCRSQLGGKCEIEVWSCSGN